MSKFTTESNLKKLHWLVGLGTLLLVALGGFVRATGAGLSCPDWPLCFGRVIPQITYGVAQEYFHRVLASIVSIGVFVISIVSYRVRHELPGAWSSARILILLLSIQVVLGGLTVLLLLNPFIVTAHLATGTLFLLVTLVIAPQRLKEKSNLVERNSTLRQWLLGLSILLFAQIVLGGFVGSSGASLSCTDMPLCGGELWPISRGAAAVFHMIHRLTALMIFSAVLVLVYFSWGTPLLRKSFGIFGLVTVQLVLGVLNVVLAIPVPVTVLHLLVAEGLLLSLVYCYLNFDSLMTPAS